MNYTGIDLVKDEVSRIVSVVSAAFIADVVPKLPESKRPYYKKVTFFWGNPLELISKLQEYTKHPTLKYEKFPFICLYNDIDIDKGKYGDYDGTLLEIVMCNATDPGYDSETRELENFIPILRPLYELFLEELKRSQVFVTANNPNSRKHKVTERYFWGQKGLYGSTGNVFNDYIDAIHIRNLDLRIDTNIC